MGVALAQVSAKALEGQTFLLMGKLVNQIKPHHRIQRV